jgi:hypothetical protein
MTLNKDEVYFIKGNIKEMFTRSRGFIFRLESISIYDERRENSDLMYILNDKHNSMYRDFRDFTDEEYSFEFDTFIDEKISKGHKRFLEEHASDEIYNKLFITIAYDDSKWYPNQAFFVPKEFSFKRIIDTFTEAYIEYQELNAVSKNELTNDIPTYLMEYFDAGVEVSGIKVKLVSNSDPFKSDNLKSNVIVLDNIPILSDDIFKHKYKHAFSTRLASSLKIAAQMNRETHSFVFICVHDTIIWMTASEYNRYCRYSEEEERYEALLTEYEQVMGAI